MAQRMTKRQLVDRLMDGRLGDYVSTRRAQSPPRSWDGIASDLRADFDIEVSGEGVRNWFGENDPAEQAS